VGLTSAAGQDDHRDLDEIGEYENFIEQMLLDVRHQVLPN
jgi:hypothetical protein